MQDKKKTKKITSPLWMQEEVGGADIMHAKMLRCYWPEQTQIGTVTGPGGGGEEGGGTGRGRESLFLQDAGGVLFLIGLV